MSGKEIIHVMVQK